MTRAEIKAVLERHRGSSAEVMRRAAVDASLVSHWLKWKANSKNVEFHATQVARELLDREAAAQPVRLRASALTATGEVVPSVSEWRAAAPAVPAKAERD